MQEEKVRQVSPLLSFIVGSVVSLLVAYMGLKGSEGDTSARTLDSAFNRISNLEQSLDKTRKENAEREYKLTLEIIELRAQITDKADTLAFMKRQNDNLPIPVWIKTFQADMSKPPIMLDINNEYTRYYGKTSDEYEGKTDYDVWPFQIAKKFEENDRKVLKLGIPISTIERVVVDGMERDVEVHKYPLQVKGKRAVGGYSLEVMP